MPDRESAFDPGGAAAERSAGAAASDDDRDAARSRPLPVSLLPDRDPAVERDRVRSFVAERVDAAGADGVVVNMSGGLDSTVTAALAVEALGADRVYGLILPFDILPALKREDSHGTAPLGWDIVVYDVTCS